MCVGFKLTIRRTRFRVSLVAVCWLGGIRWAAIRLSQFNGLTCCCGIMAGIDYAGECVSLEDKHQAEEDDKKCAHVLSIDKIAKWLVLSTSSIGY